MMTDPDHVVRAEASRLLAFCDSPTSKSALQRALTDGSVVVREAAAASIARLDGTKPPPVAAPGLDGLNAPGVQHV
jgi:hypothetical protein